MPTPEEIVNSFLGDKVKDSLDFMFKPNQEAPTLYENIKLNTKRIEEETQKKQNINFEE